MKKISVFCGILTLFICCDTPLAEKPEHLLSKKEFAEVLVELSSIQAAYDANFFNRQDALKDKERDFFYLRLYKKYGINQEILNENILYYLERNRDFVAVYKLALQQVEKFDLNDTFSTPKLSQDSLVPIGELSK